MSKLADKLCLSCCLRQPAFFPGLGHQEPEESAPGSDRCRTRFDPSFSRRYNHVWLGKGGSNSVVECDLAKVEVAGSNPVSRSNISLDRARARAAREPFIGAPAP